MIEAKMQDELNRQSRLSSSVVWLSFLGLVIFVLWARWAILDEVTVGTGKVTPSTHAQVIESLDGGIVSQLLVKEGDIVNRGQMLGASTRRAFNRTSAKRRYASARFGHRASV